MKLLTLHGGTATMQDGEVTEIRSLDDKPIDAVQRAGFKLIAHGPKSTIYAHAQCLDQADLPTVIYLAFERGGHIAIAPDHFGSEKMDAVLGAVGLR